MHDSALRGEGASFNVGPASAGAEQRGAPRFTMLIRAGKLVLPQGEFLCVVRDASETGVSVRLFHRLPRLDEAILEMPNGDRHRVEAVWQEDDKAGFRFTDDIDIARLVENPSDFARRPMRVNVELKSTARFLGRAIDIEIHNISQQGAQIAVNERLAIDQRLKLGGGILPEIEAKVRWRSENVYGLVFEDTFQLAELARILGAIQLGSLA